MITRRLLLPLAVAALSLAACSSSGTNSTDRFDLPADGPGWLNGQEQSIVVVGYSTSYAWPDMLQEMLDEHAGSPGVYHVLNAVAGGAAVEIWIADPGTRNHERTIDAMVSDFFGDDARLRGDAPQPTIAICQQSLQFTFDRRGPVKEEHDMVGAELGADALEKLATRLRDLGLEHVIYGMHVYKKPVEPEVGNERIALARLIARGHGFISQGPDVWQVTRDGYPDCFEEDGIHPNEAGMKLMAEGWYRALAGASARDDVVDRMKAKDYDIDSMMKAYLAWRRGE